VSLNDTAGKVHAQKHFVRVFEGLCTRRDFFHREAYTNQLLGESKANILMATSALSLAPQLPHFQEAERCVLGAIFLHNEYLVEVLEKGLRTDDFFIQQHRVVFEAMIRLDGEHKPIDLLTVNEDLRAIGSLERAGGVAFLAQLIDGIPRVVNVGHWTQIIREKSVLRDIITASQKMQTQALEASESVDAILGSAENSVFKIAEDRAKLGLVGLREVVRQNFERISQIYKEGRRVTGLSTGYDQLDNLTSGLQPSELIILAARPSMGKTAFALNIAENVAVRDKKSVAVFSLEMSKESLLLRLLSSDAKIDSHKFRTGHLSREDGGKIPTSLSRLAEAPVWIDDSGSATVTEMSAKARRMMRDRGISLVVVDYLQLISTNGRFNNRNEEVASITRGLKGLAKELKVPVLVLSQLTRAPEREDRQPMLSDLRESGAIEQDADVVMFIHRPNFFKKSSEVTMEERGETDLIIAKQRNGPTDTIRFVFQGSFTRFEQRAPDAWTEPE
jgi:replicative DNA helicase